MINELFNKDGNIHKKHRTNNQGLTNMEREEEKERFTQKYKIRLD